MDDEMSGACKLYGKDEKLIQYLTSKFNGKSHLRRPKHGWEDNIKMVLEKQA
jgi:hypothetical protein